MSDETFWTLVWGSIGWALAFYSQWQRRKEIIRFNAAREDLEDSLAAAESAAEDFEQRYINCASELADLTNPPQWVPASKPVGLKP